MCVSKETPYYIHIIRYVIKECLKRDTLLHTSQERIQRARRDEMSHVACTDETKAHGGGDTHYVTSVTSYVRITHRYRMGIVTCTYEISQYVRTKQDSLHVYAP